MLVPTGIRRSLIGLLPLLLTFLPGTEGALNEHDLRGASQRMSITRGFKKTSSDSSKKKSPSCTFDQDLNMAIFRLLTTPRSSVASFLDGEGRAIDEILPFLKLIRNTQDGTDEEDLIEEISDMELILATMAPNPIVVNPGDDSGPLVPFDSPIFNPAPTERKLQDINCDNYNQILAARALDLIVETFDFTFAKVGLGGSFGGLGKAVGRNIARKILSGPNGRAFAQRLPSIISQRNPSGIVDLLSSTVAEVGLNGVLDAVSEASSNPWALALFGVGLAANIVASLASGGVVLVAKIASFALSTIDLYSAFDAITELSDACPPTSQPTSEPTPMPTPQPTPMPTPPPIPIPTPQPTPMPTPPPVPPPPPGRTSGVFGDPHLSTFDRLRFACQAGGEFTMLTSLETPEFAIQERFVSVGSNQCTQASVSAGVVVSEPGLPSIQLSLPRDPTDAGASSGTVQVSLFGNFCPVDLYVNGVLQNTLSFSDGSVMVEPLGTGIEITYPATGLQVRPTVRFSESFRCHLNLQIFLPLSYRMNESLIGLLGIPNGRSSDDWVTPTGDPYSAVPSTVEESVFGDAYKYCTSQWCVRNAINSGFTYRSGESFDDFNQCDVTYDEEIETSIQEAINRNDPIIEVCGTDNLFCLVDGLCGGGVEDARAVLTDEAEIIAAQELSNPTESPSTVPSEIVTAIPSLTPSVSPSLSPSSSKSSSSSKGKGKKGGS